MTRFARRGEEILETQNWRVELKVVVADARCELIPRDASARALQSGSEAHLRICLGKLDSRLTCSLVASPLSADSSSLSRPLGNPRTRLTLALVPFSVSPLSSSGNISSVLSPGYFSLGVRSYCRVRIPWGPRIGPLSPELSVNAPFVSSFLQLSERKRKRN